MPATTTTASVDIPPELEGFELRTVTVRFGDGESSELLVAVADDPAERAQGLMFVTDLRDLDGMLFDFPEDTLSRFWMSNTILPLTLVHFDSEGSFVSMVDMEPAFDLDCETTRCPTYPPAGPFRFALEVPAGTFAEPPDTLE